jgi:hypothetical protein
MMAGMVPLRKFIITNPVRRLTITNLTKNMIKLTVIAV